MQNTKIPIIVGVAGHRNVAKEDKEAIKEKVKESLLEIKNLCGNTPIIMLNAFAQGADMLCAEVAFDLGIDVYAVLPCPEEEYILSFNDEDDKPKLHGYLAKTKSRVLVAPDIEQNKEWLGISDKNYRYRQLGIYMAEHSHVLIALWDGNPPDEKFGCGTVEIINFALKHNFLDKDHLFKPGTINDSAVVWIKTRRQGDKPNGMPQKKWLINNPVIQNTNENKDGALDAQKNKSHIESDNPPDFLKEIISKTCAYNNESFPPKEKRKLKKNEEEKSGLKLWENANEVDEYRRSLDYHYSKADNLSYAGNQKFYNKFLLILAILGTLVALLFLIYDDVSLPYMIFPCSAILGAILMICFYGRKKKFQQNYIEYRAFAEVMRIQFYLSMCINEKEITTNVCDLCSWTQRVNMAWIDKAIKALAVIHPAEKLTIPTDNIIHVWVEGQLAYHLNKKESNEKKAKAYTRLAVVFQCLTILIYATILIFEIITCILHGNWFWSGISFGHVSWRNLGAVILGVFTAGSLLLASYFGKLSYDRKVSDNKKMALFYAMTCERWNEVRSHPKEVEKFVTAVAREEIVENGIWCSYVNENRLEINI